MFTITLGHLLERGASFQRYEAIAIAQELIARREGVPAIDNVQLSSDGSVSCISTRGTPQVSDVAALLQALLPTASGQVPAPLRYTLARGLGLVEAPPFESLDAFSESLARFEAGDRHGVIRALLQRVADAPPPKPRRVVVSTSAVPTVVAPRTPVPPPVRPAAQPPRAVPQPTRAAPIAAPAPAAASPVRAPMFSSGSAPASEPINWGVALLAIAASFVIGAIGGQRAGIWQDPPAAAVAGASAAKAPASRGPAHTSAPQSRDGERAVPTTGNVQAPAPQDASPAPIPPAPQDAPPAKPARVIGGAAQAAFSPAFSPNGTAMFFHTGGAGDARSAIAMSPSANASAGAPRVVTVLDDGARNYHPQPSPDGRLIAFDSDRDGERGVYVANADGTNARRISGPGHAAAPTWSPDGKRLAYVRSEAANRRVWNLWVQGIDETRATRVTRYAYGQTWSASWFPDNRRICYTHEDKVVVRDLATRRDRQFGSPVAGRLVRTPAVSPDGSKVVFQVFRNGAWLLDLANGSMRRILADPTAEEFAWAPDGHRIAFHTRRDGEWGIHIMAPG